MFKQLTDVFLGDHHSAHERVGRYAMAGMLWVLFLIAGCQTQLMPTPNLYLHAPDKYFSAVPADFRSNQADLLYVTDRKPVLHKNGEFGYGYERSASMAYGSCVVEIGKHVSWEELVKNSSMRKRRISLPLSVLSIREQNRFPETPLPVVVRGGEILIDPNSEAEEERVAREFQQEIMRRLEKSPSKPVYLMVHGNFASFEDAAFMMGGIWHFLERRGVPIVYSWPAGSPGGILRRYTYDTTSGTFTVYHLKQFLRWLGECAGVEKIHIISHSQGTNVICNAIRELILEARAAGENPQTKFKIGNLVLAAPDIDYEVALQRIATERFYTGVERMTIYVSKRDQLLGMANWLFRQERIGQVRASDVTESMRERGEMIHRTDVIDADVKTGSEGHYYFYTSPAVSSDLILLLRDHRAAGKEYGRPLIPVIPNYWQIHDDYLMDSGTHP